MVSFGLKSQGTRAMSKPQLMVILNVTPDSFFAETRCFQLESAIERAHVVHQAGADMLDIGGESTRPNAEPVGAEEEMKRLSLIHISEPTRLGMISYAVFCLKKK